MADSNFEVVDFDVYNVNSDCVPTDKELQETAFNIARAIKRNGLVHLKNTALCEGKLRGAWEYFHQFRRLPTDQQKPYTVVQDNIPDVHVSIYEPPSCHGNYGYEADNKEAMLFWPRNNKITNPESEVPGFRAAMKTLSDELLILAIRVLECLALGFGFGRHGFDYTFQSLKDDEWNHSTSPSCMRLNYFRNKRDVEAEGLPQKRFGAHRDITLLTIVQPDEKGLQMQSETGEWVDIPIIPGTCIVQIGMAMTHMTGIKAPRHQVVFTGEESDDKERTSTIFFLLPDSNCLLKPAPEAVSQTPKCLSDLGLDLS